MKLEHAVDAEDFVFETIESDYIGPTVSNAYQTAYVSQILTRIVLSIPGEPI
jgi:hypothetical protein